MTNTEQQHSDPVVAGRLVRRGRYWYVKVRCPYCKRTHTHGAGEDGTEGGGHRVAHCSSGPGLFAGYFIQVEDGP